MRSEVGRLRTVMLHRPGNELKRLTPRNNDALLFDGLPWVDRAQEEHDAFAAALRGRGRRGALPDHAADRDPGRPGARAPGDRADPDRHPARRLAARLPAATSWPTSSPEDLAEILVAGLRNDEVRDTGSLVAALQAPDDFLIDPLPNLLFTRDSSVWVQDRATITSLAMPARRRETQLTELIYAFHPRFAGVERIHGWEKEYLEGGDVLALADGVLAVGVGERTRPSGAERLARTAFDLGPGPHRAGGADRPGPGDHAPGHHLHHGRRRRGGDVPQRRAPAVGADRPGDGPGELVLEPMAPFLDRRGARPWASTSCG